MLTADRHTIRQNKNCAFWEPPFSAARQNTIHMCVLLYDNTCTPPASSRPTAKGARVRGFGYGSFPPPAVAAAQQRRRHTRRGHSLRQHHASLSSLLRCPLPFKPHSKTASTKSATLGATASSAVLGSSVTAKDRALAGISTVIIGKNPATAGLPPRQPR